MPEQTIVLIELKKEDLELLNKVIIDFNKYALEWTNFNKIEEAHYLFEKLVKLCNNYSKQEPKLIWLTFNNLSCLHKKTGDLK